MRRALVLGLSLASTALACDSGETSDDRATNVAAAGAPSESLPPRSLPIAAAGWLDHEESPITPWCGAVLVAPDVAVTAARCVEGWDIDWFRVGFGDTGTRSYAIAEVLEQEDAVDPTQALVALRLDAPVVGIDPAELDTDSRTRPVCDVLGVAYLHALRGDLGGRWIWSGCLDGSTVRTTSGVPNCHGDMGSGAFTSREAGGRLIGIAVDVGDARDELGCAREHRLESVTENAGFFDRALDLSQPPS
jgi:hypothetical protein